MKRPDDSEVERQRLMESIPAHRYGTVEDVAHEVSFLLLGVSSYINGAVNTGDGAFTAFR